MKLHRHARKVAIGFLLLVLVLVVAAVISGIVARRKGDFQQVVLADGIVFKLVGATFGHEHELPRSKPREFLHSIAPPVLKKMMGPVFTATFGFGGEGLALWVLTHDPATGTYSPPPGNYRIVTVDDHGCEFTSSNSGSTGDAVYSASILNFPAFPRRQKTFLCRVLKDSGANAPPQVIGELRVENPSFPCTCVEWEPEAVPSVKTNGPIVVQLDSFDPTNGAQVTVLRDSESSPWRLRSQEYEDATGNRGQEIFCPKERAWKFSRTYFQTEKGRFGSNELWTLPVTTLPAPGTIAPSGLTNVLNGSWVRVLYFIGAGTYTFSNDVCVAATPWGPGSRAEFSSMSGWRGQTRVKTMTFGYGHPFAIVEHAPLGDDAEFMLRVSDGGQVVAAARGASGMDGKYFYELRPVGADHSATSIGGELKMDIVIQRGRTVQFLVGSPAPSDAAP